MKTNLEIMELLRPVHTTPGYLALFSLRERIKCLLPTLAPEKCENAAITGGSLA